MRVQAPFGFVTGCHAGDKFMVQAALASMRHYCPTVPICLTVDGDFDVSDLEKDYNLIVLRISDLESTEIRQVIKGSFHAKHAALWEGPFEYYVWIDSDALIWGDFTAQIRTDVDFQIMWNEISIPAGETVVPSWLPHFYLDPLKLRKYDPDFEWRGLAYFSAGAFAVRRNAIPFERYREIESLGRKEDGLFAWGDMGMLNYMVYAAAQRGQLKTAMSDLQHIPDHLGKTEFVEDCAGAGWRFPQKIRRPRVAHFCGHKPFLFDPNAYSRPFTIARLEHYRRSRSNWRAWWRVISEDSQVLRRKVQRRLRFA